MQRGNDITFVWRIKDPKGQPIDLSKFDKISMYIQNSNYPSIRVLPEFVIDGGLRFIFQDSDQKASGFYNLVMLAELQGKNYKVDHVKAFELTDHAELHCVVGDDDHMAEIDTCLSRYLDGRDGRSPYIGANGNWFVYDDLLRAFTDTGKLADYADLFALEVKRVTAKLNEADQAIAGQIRRVDAAMQSASEAISNVNHTNETVIRNENERITTEQSRVLAEQARASAENTRVGNETARGNAEQSRANAESSRVSAEQSRVSVESKRVSSESGRASAEQSRVSAEQSRSTAESGRSSAESTRVTQENTRKSNETSRVNAESARVSAEQSRVTEEGKRVAAETKRQTDTAQAIQNTNTAAQNATDVAAGMEGQIVQLQQELDNICMPYSVYDCFDFHGSDPYITSVDAINIKNKLINSISYYTDGNQYNARYLIFRSSNGNTEIGFFFKGYDLFFRIKKQGVIVKDVDLTKKANTIGMGVWVAIIDCISGKCSLQHSKHGILYNSIEPEVVNVDEKLHLLVSQGTFGARCYFSAIYNGYADFSNLLSFTPTVGGHTPDIRFEGYKKTKTVDVCESLNPVVALRSDRDITPDSSNGDQDKTYTIPVAEKRYLTIGCIPPESIITSKEPISLFVKVCVVSGSLTILQAQAAEFAVFDESGDQIKTNTLIAGKTYTIFWSTGAQDFNYYTRYSTYIENNTTATVRVYNPVLVHRRLQINTPSAIVGNKISGDLPFTSPYYYIKNMPAVKSVNSLSNDTRDCIVGQHLFQDGKMYITFLEGGKFINKLAIQ